jgi:hypothetical protein
MSCPGRSLHWECPLPALKGKEEGFALVAFPSSWSKSGVMTFIVNQQGKVYQKNFGLDTVKIVQKMRSYAPDETWTPVKE